MTALGGLEARHRLKMTARLLERAAVSVRTSAQAAANGSLEHVRAWDAGRLSIGASVVILGVFAGLRILAIDPWSLPAFDSYSYWITRAGLDYASAVQGQTGAFLYSPAFAQVIGPLAALPWPVFAGLWTLIIAAPLLWLAGRLALPIALLPPVAMSIALGQLDLAFAVVAVVGLRWPVVWALPILTKLTPGVGLVWFLVRREWRSLGLALGATAVIAGVSFALDPTAWLGWLALLMRFDFPALGGGLLLVPVDLWLRLPAAAVLVAWGARTDRHWTIPVALCLALPTIFLNSPTILIALIPLLAAGKSSPAARWLAARP